MTEEYAMSPETAESYYSRERALRTKIVDEKTMLFRLKSDGVTVETKIVREKDVRPEDLNGGWVDSRAKCASPEIYKLAQEYPDRRAGQLRAMIKDRKAGLDRAVRNAASETDDRAVLEMQYEQKHGRKPHPSTSTERLKERLSE